MVIEQYKTGFEHPSDIAFEDLSVTGSMSTGNSIPNVQSGKGTFGGRARRRAGLRALFNNAKVSCYAVTA